MKNMLLVMETAGIFHSAEGYSELWAITWDRIDTFLPSLREQVFTNHPPTSASSPNHPLPDSSSLQTPAATDASDVTQQGVTSLEAGGLPVFRMEAAEMSEPPADYDRVVIGAGIIGSCTAYQLLKAGHRRVLLIDQLCYHVGVPCDPDRRDTVRMDGVLQTTKEYVARTFPGLEPEPAIVETCMYTVTPDERCQGFKMGPVFAEVLQQLVDGQKSQFDLTTFSAERFSADVSHL
ncbi:Peroxisomal sarcosine oxidase [Amphibalanus amphitrite]|uniref:Peroxisomal sarcosine oxidase n=1 Tax=Amphibalanus amphitrite TaxID=1232801 RepID=A0A6A4VYB9_AMPAM|nr:Peroxisomal sarcosine oxidase [Amphibalanus amphitrite]